MQMPDLCEECSGGLNPVEGHTHERVGGRQELLGPDRASVRARGCGAVARGLALRPPGNTVVVAHGGYRQVISYRDPLRAVFEDDHVDPARVIVVASAACCGTWFVPRC